MITLALAIAWSAVVVAMATNQRPLAPAPPRGRRTARPGRRIGPARRWPRIPGPPPSAKFRRAARRRAAVEAAAPDVVDLFAVAVASGLNVRLATDAVAARAPPGPLADELRSVIEEVDAGSRLADALDRLAARVAGNETVRTLVAALLDAERYGTALAPTLDGLATEARLARHRRAEEAARRVPVKLLFPLVTCILPAFALLTVAPLVAGGLRALRL